MTKNFGYVKAGSLTAAIKELSTKEAVMHAGGIDLMNCARSEIIPVEKVVSISALKQLRGISARSDGGIRIGALTTLADIAADASILEKYPVLAQAAAAVGSPQIRAQATIGGNLCQRPRCWYFRSDLQCLKKGGSTCYGAGGENQYHAIFGGGPCFFVHPSDPAVALVSLQAQLAITGPSGTKSVRIENFFISPKQNVTRENILAPGEIITEIRIPAAAANTKSSYHKIMARGSWDFALTSVAAVLQLENGSVRSARIALGGVATYPWRVEAAENLLQGKKLDGTIAAAAAEAAAMGARPLRDNKYKVEMVKGAIEESLVAFT
jgi:xanthine dehydrogenase YagS FAD-binding subunit